MKIVHTADWHLGKILHKQSLEPEITAFLDWLLSYMKNEEVDVLLIAGDIFDSSNPTNQARKLYYNFLLNVSKLDVSVVIIGGNHDSISHLDAAADLLEVLDIHVVGGMPDEYTDVIKVIDKRSVKLGIAAIPYLRDRDLRSGTNTSIEEREKQLRLGNQKVYQEVFNFMEAMENLDVTIAMGHLHINGSTESDSERKIIIGNLHATQADRIINKYDYIALGHIHRPQSFCDNKVVYSGSPIALSFSEYKDIKRVVLIECDGDSFTQSTVEVPVFRRLLRLKGTFDDIKMSIQNYQNTNELPTFCEVLVEEQLYDFALLLKVRDYMRNLERDDIVIVQLRFNFETSPNRLPTMEPQKQIGDLKPIEVFEKKLQSTTFSKEEKEELLSSYKILELLARE